MRDELIHRRIVDALGMQLLIDVGVDAHLAHGGHVTRARPEREAVEHLRYLLVSGLLAGDGRLRLLSERAGRGERERQNRRAREYSGRSHVIPHQG